MTHETLPQLTQLASHEGNLLAARKGGGRLEASAVQREADSHCAGGATHAQRAGGDAGSEALL
jgi:hypothetical protein